ncbi:hypothetical protein [Mucilaginibacter auburnensis]|nr:hypothetical protein [Mucilaginibacter auburnensis]
MKTVCYLFYCSILVAFGCRGKSPAMVSDSTKVVSALDTVGENVTTGFKPYTLAENYIVTDTGFFDFDIGDGTYAVVKQQGRLIDTIDKYYGFQPLSKGAYAYYAIEGSGQSKTEAKNSKSILADISHFMIITGNKKIDVTRNAPYFGWFANPSILKNSVYYWEVKEQKDSYKIFAAKFDPKTRLTNSFYLFNSFIDSDDGGYFAMPYLRGDTICFEHNDGKITKFSPDFKSYN